MKRFLIIGLTVLFGAACNGLSPSEPKNPHEYKFQVQLLDGGTLSPVVGEDVVATSPDGYDTDHAKTIAPDGKTPVVILKNNGPLDANSDVQIRTGGIISGYQRYTGPAHRLEELRDQGRTLYVATVYLTRQ